MICLETRAIKLRGKSRGIVRFDVWWAVPGKGLYTDIKEALEVSTTLLPAPVAIADDGTYELLPPEVQR